MNSSNNLFRLFGLEPCPWLEPVVLKERFREAAARLHPDTQGGSMDAFTVLNEAFAILRDPGQRLRHLVEVAFPGHEPVTKTGPEEKLFLQTAKALEGGKKALAMRDKAQTALGRLASKKEFSEAQQLVEQVLKQIERELKLLETDLKNLGAEWQSVGAGYYLNLASQFAYLQRWQRELSEMRFRLEISGLEKSQN